MAILQGDNVNFAVGLAVLLQGVAVLIDLLWDWPALLVFLLPLALNWIDIHFPGANAN